MSLNFFKCPQNFILKLSTLIVTEKLQSHFFAVRETLNSDKYMTSVAEWLARWTQAQKARVQVAVATLSGNSLRQIVHFTPVVPLFTKQRNW